MKKKIIYLLLLCLCFTLNNQSSNAAASDIKKEAGYISLNTSVVKETIPDTAAITFAVENTNNDAKKAAEENKKIANNVINAVKSIISTETDSIKTTGYSVTPAYINTQGKNTIKNYKAVNTITFETKDISKIADIIDTAIANGANRTNSLSYSLQNTKSYCNDIYPELLKDLKSQASAIASAAGTSLDGVKHINATCNTVSSNVNRLAFAKQSSDSAGDVTEVSTPIEAGTIKIRVYLNADFYLK